MRLLWILIGGLGARSALAFLWWSKENFVDLFGSFLWPLVGVVLAPMTVLAWFAARQFSDDGVSGLWWAAVVFGALLDLSVYGTGVGDAKMNKRYRTTK